MQKCQSFCLFFVLELLPLLYGQGMEGGSEGELWEEKKGEGTEKKGGREVKGCCERKRRVKEEKGWEGCEGLLGQGVEG